MVELKKVLQGERVGVNALEVDFEHLHPELQQAVSELRSARRGRFWSSAVAAPGFVVAALGHAHMDLLNQQVLPNVAFATGIFTMMIGPVAGASVNQKVKDLTKAFGTRLRTGPILHPEHEKKYRLFGDVPADEWLRKSFKYAFVKRNGNVVFSNDKGAATLLKPFRRSRVLTEEEKEFPVVDADKLSRLVKEAKRRIQG